MPLTKIDIFRDKVLNSPVPVYNDADQWGIQNATPAYNADEWNNLFGLGKKAEQKRADQATTDVINNYPDPINCADAEEKIVRMQAEAETYMQRLASGATGGTKRIAERTSDILNGRINEFKAKMKIMKCQEMADVAEQQQVAELARSLAGTGNLAAKSKAGDSSVDNLDFNTIVFMSIGGMVLITGLVVLLKNR